jgi:Tol biopolymer transport system component
MRKIRFLSLILLALTACNVVRSARLTQTPLTLPANFPPQVFSDQTISNGGRMVGAQSVSGVKSIWVTNINGSTSPVQLTIGPANDYSPVWSPDGLKIAFVSDRDNNPEVYVMKADGSEQTRLTNNAVSDTLPVWSPDSQKIAFVSNRDNNSEIYSMDADGGNQTRLTNDLAFDTMPTWSLDGKMIAYISAKTENISEGDLFVINADGTGRMSYIDYAIPDKSVLAFDPNGKEKNCSAFKSQIEAQLFYIAAGGPLRDPHGLDESGIPGQACESLP